MIKLSAKHVSSSIPNLSSVQPLIASGQSTIPTTCTVCEHNPVSAGDCKPHKSLRTTIRVFLRTAEKKREALRAKDTVKETPPATPSTPTVPAAVAAIEPSNATAAVENAREIAASTEEPAAEAIQTENVSETPTENNGQEPVLSEDQMDVPQQSIEVGFVLIMSCLFANSQKRKSLLVKNVQPMP